MTSHRLNTRYATTDNTAVASGVAHPVESEGKQRLHDAGTGQRQGSPRQRVSGGVADNQLETDGVAVGEDRGASDEGADVGGPVEHHPADRPTAVGPGAEDLQRLFYRIEGMADG
jgi:hypothetical protein